MMVRQALRMVAGLCLAVLWASPMAAAAEEGLPHPRTWLDWVFSLRMAGHPLFTNQAVLAFAWSLVAIVLLTVVSVVGTRRVSVRPRGLQTLLELVVGGLRGVVVSVMGPRGVEFVPFVGTLFVYIAVMNLMSLVPGCMAPTSNLSITAGLAIMVFVVVQYCGVREQGVGYVKHFLEGVPMQFPYVLLAPLVFAVHLVGEVFRPVTLALRLFGNLMAEETVVLILIGLAAPLFARWWLPVPAQLPNMLLGMLVSVVQAAIFSMLTAVYLSRVLRHPEGANQ